MKILLISPPVFMPTIMPYSLAKLYSDLKSKLNEEIIAIDLNAKFHKLQFKNYYEKLNQIKQTTHTNQQYLLLLEEFINHTRTIYPSISKNVRNNFKPLQFNNILNQITKEKPDIVGISLTYNSQIFYTKPLIEELNKLNIKVILGGSADYSKIMKDTLTLPNSTSLIEYLIKNGAKPKEQNNQNTTDFSQFNNQDYFSKETIHPLRTSISCPYKQCTFCTHHLNQQYKQLDLKDIEQTIINNNIKKAFLIDDDIPINRLKQIAIIMKKHQVKWWCQLRPIKNLIPHLKELNESGLISIAWGLESANQRTLDLMHKGTNTNDIKKVLKASKDANIINMTYIMLGFPSQTKEEIETTIQFLEENKENIDIISPSIFGLQQGSKIYNNPKQFNIKEITHKKRTLLSDNINYEPTTGLTNNQTKEIKKKNQHKINNINSYNKVLARCKEQVLNLN
jgi:radical SAM superfamily enzyme YgiQ (UPF0313 family)